LLTCRIGIAVRVLLVIALFGLPAGVQAEGDDDGLVAQWHFDEGSGSVLADSSGNGNDGVIHGATWVEGKYGGALSFDGVDDYVEAPYSDILDIKDDITIGGWFKTTTNDNSDDGLVSNWGDRGMGHILWTYQGAILFDNSGNSQAVKWAGGMTSFANGEWHHIVTTKSGTTGKIYFDGNEKASGTLSITTHVGTQPLQIGTYNTRTISSFNGLIDEVCIYNRALNAEKIKTHYEHGPVELTITKSAAPHSIKQDQTTTITLTVKNTGTTEITDIEVSDTIPSDLILVSGETSKTYTSLRPKDSREFQYVLQPSDAGTFNLDPATATYADEEGNYHTTESKTATITVIPSTDQPATPHTTKNPSADISTASVHLHGEKTDVVLGEDVLLKLSAVNIIGNPLMRVQVIIIPPSGWSVTSSEFAKSGAGQYTTTYDIESGVGRDIEVRIMPNQIGDDFQVRGRIIYYFGDDSDAREDHTLTLPITVRAEAENGQGAERTADTSGSKEKGSSTPGFAAVVAVIGLLAVYLRGKRR